MKTRTFLLAFILILQSCFLFEEGKDAEYTGRLVSIGKSNMCYGSVIVVNGRSFVTEADIQQLRTMLFKTITVYYNTSDRCGLSYKTKEIKNE